MVLVLKKNLIIILCIVFCSDSGSLAQRLEQFAHNELVVGSNPTGPTMGRFLFLIISIGLLMIAILNVISVQ